MKRGCKKLVDRYGSIEAHYAGCTVEIRKDEGCYSVWVDDQGQVGGGGRVITRITELVASWDDIVNAFRRGMILNQWGGMEAFEWDCPARTELENALRERVLNSWGFLTTRIGDCKVVLQALYDGGDYGWNITSKREIPGREMECKLNFKNWETLVETSRDGWIGGKDITDWEWR